MNRSQPSCFFTGSAPRWAIRGSSRRVLLSAVALLCAICLAGCLSGRTARDVIAEKAAGRVEKTQKGEVVQVEKPGPHLKALMPLAWLADALAAPIVVLEIIWAGLNGYRG